MLRLLLLGLCFTSGVAVAAAQTAPYPPSNMPQQPGPPQQPGSTQQQQPNDPNAIPGAPPSFVPGVGGGNDAGPSTRRHAVRISGGVMAGNIVSKVDPVYPDDAKSAHLSGSVVMAAHIGTNGRVESLSVVSGPGPLQHAAVNAVKQWTYKPYLLNGEPVAVDTTVTVNFNLH